MASDDGGHEYAEDVAAALVRGIGAFIRVAQITKLTPALRPLRSFRPQTLARRRSELLASLNDDDLRAAVVEWLDEGHVPLKKGDAELLRIAATREDGWEARLAPADEPQGPADSAAAELEARVARLEELLERERDKVRSARAEARRAKEESRGTIEARRGLEEQLLTESAALAAARKELNEATAETERVRAAADKDARRAARAAERLSARAEEHGRQLRDARKELGRAQRRAAEQEAESERLKGRIGGLKSQIATLNADVERLTGDLDHVAGTAQGGRSTRKAPAARPGRVPLGVPKGRMPEDPQTLEEWLGAPQVRLLVDGYNVTKAEGGYGGVPLERQRERLVAEVGSLVARKKVRTVIVFDGSEVTPGRGRRMHGGVIVEYSAPGETADDYLVGLLAGPKNEGEAVAPAIVVTNDRGLQERAAARGATIATSNQLLALIR